MIMLRKLLNGCVLLLVITTKAEIKVSETKNLYSIVDEHRKHCSPFNGMIWWQNNIIKHMYLIGDSKDATIRLRAYPEIHKLEKIVI